MKCLWCGRKDDYLFQGHYCDNNHKTYYFKKRREDFINRMNPNDFVKYTLNNARIREPMRGPRINKPEKGIFYRMVSKSGTTTLNLKDIGYKEGDIIEIKVKVKETAKNARE